MPRIPLLAEAQSSSLKVFTLKKYKTCTNVGLLGFTSLWMTTSFLPLFLSFECLQVNRRKQMLGRQRGGRSHSADVSVLSAFGEAD